MKKKVRTNIGTLRLPLIYDVTGEASEVAFPTHNTSALQEYLFESGIFCNFTAESLEVILKDIEEGNALTATDARRRRTNPHKEWPVHPTAGQPWSGLPHDIPTGFLDRSDDRRVFPEVYPSTADASLNSQSGKH